MRYFFAAILTLSALCVLAALALPPVTNELNATGIRPIDHLLPGINNPQGTFSMTVPGLFILLLVAFPLAAIMGCLFLAALKILKGNGDGRGGEADQEETRLIQELHRGLRRMEERVDALETLLTEKSTHRKTHE